MTARYATFARTAPSSEWFFRQIMLKFPDPANNWDSAFATSTDCRLQQFAQSLAEDCLCSVTNLMFFPTLGSLPTGALGSHNYYPTVK